MENKNDVKLQTEYIKRELIKDIKTNYKEIESFLVNKNKKTIIEERGVF